MLVKQRLANLEKVVTRKGNSKERLVVWERPDERVASVTGNGGTLLFAGTTDEVRTWLQGTDMAGQAIWVEFKEAD